MGTRRVAGALAVVLLELTPVAAFDDSEREVEPARGTEQALAARERIVELEGNAPHRLRGDWEAPDSVLFAFTEHWSETLALLVSTALDQADVYLLADPTVTTPEQVRSWLGASNLPEDRVHVLWERIDTPWVRDYGPLQLAYDSGGDATEPLWVDPDYRPERRSDDAIPAALERRFGVPTEPLPLYFQGGAIIGNGQGLCASTVEYFEATGVDPDDGPQVQWLLDRLGCRVLALLPALQEDPTHHVDLFAQFLAPDAVAVAQLDQDDDPEDAERMDIAARALEDAAARMGLRLRTTRVPMPYAGGGKYLTYLNGLRLASDFVVPSYGEAPPELERAAYALLAAAMPGTAVVDVPADNVIPLAGSLHCISLGLFLR